MFRTNPNPWCHTAIRKPEPRQRHLQQNLARWGLEKQKSLKVVQDAESNKPHSKRNQTTELGMSVKMNEIHQGRLQQSHCKARSTSSRLNTTGHMEGSGVSFPLLSFTLSNGRWGLGVQREYFIPIWGQLEFRISVTRRECSTECPGGS